MIKRIGYYWNRDKEAVWSIAYRRKVQGKQSVLKDKTRPFMRFAVEKDFWAADPLAVTHDGKDYLFYEYYDAKKEKGLLACSVMEDGQLSKPKIILEEPFHLSFPFVFRVDNEYYMIPETGAVKQIILYKCMQFPYQWKKERVLLEGVTSSDTIVFSKEGKLFLLASILKEGKATTAQNQLYTYDLSSHCLEYCCTAKETGEKGVRNGGGLFTDGEIWIRPGQNCTGGYGKSLLFFEVEQVDKEGYLEKVLAELSADEITIEGAAETFDGIHTYSSTEQYEYIDLKRIVKIPMAKRVCRMGKIFIGFIKGKLKRH